MMKSILGNNEESISQVKRLLNMSVPYYRQAYSDRTSWIMSCMSELAYLRFNPLFASSKPKDFIIESVSKMLGENKKSSLIKLIDKFGYDHNEELKKLESEISVLRFELVETFDEGGTQAILVSNNKFIVLAFRGTEATSIKDIKADTNAIIKECDSGGKIHSGFSNAYENVSLRIIEKLKDPNLADMPLFITGHSLGGALATVAAKKLSHRGGIAACYTFGSPRVGNDQWISNIKAPLYRLVNAADCVTMMPPGDEVVSVLAWLSRFIPSVGLSVQKWILTNLEGYLHAGNMRYLTNCKKGVYSNTKLLYSVSFWRRIKGLIIKKLPWKKFLSDHSISIYRQKLWVIAQRNNIK